ncbi:MAG TPA: MFS transporter [Patescibacteria group bacterium]
MKKTSKHIEHADEKKLELINFISFLFGFSQALLIYVLSDYFRQALGFDNVSLFYLVSYAIVLLFLLNMHKFIRWLGKATVFFLFFFLQICFVAFLIFVPPSTAGIFLLMLYIIANYLAYVSLDIMVESYSEDKRSGRIRGLHMTILNAGFIIGPLISTRVLEKFGFDGLFFLSMVMNMILFLVGLVNLRGANQRFAQKLTTRDLVKKIFVNKDVMKIYAISFTLEFFYALMIVYTPLYLLDRGLSWSQIGIAFTVMLIPFVVLEYPLGYLADKKFGEKEMITIGLIILSISTLSIFFVSSNAVWVWSLVLLATRIGAAMIEILRDSYFYKRIDGRDVDVISFFRTAVSVAYVAATALSALLLLFVSVKYVFLFLGALILLGLLPALRLVDNKSEAEMKMAKEFV